MGRDKIKESWGVVKKFPLRYWRSFDKMRHWYTVVDKMRYWLSRHALLKCSHKVHIVSPTFYIYIKLLGEAIWRFEVKGPSVCWYHTTLLLLFRWDSWCSVGMSELGRPNKLKVSSNYILKCCYWICGKQMGFNWLWRCSRFLWAWNKLLIPVQSHSVIQNMKKHCLLYWKSYIIESNKPTALTRRSWIPNCDKICHPSFRVWSDNPFGPVWWWPRDVYLVCHWHQWASWGCPSPSQGACPHASWRRPGPKAR